MGTKIVNLPQIVTPNGSDILPISQDNGGTRTTYKATIDQIKDYVKNSGGGTGSVTSVGVQSTDNSLSVFGSPIVGAGTINLSVSSVGIDKLKSGGATAGQVLTYDGSTNTWMASAAPAGFINNVDNAPIGSVVYLAVATAPTGYLECDGGIVSKSQYSDLWSTIGDTFSAVALSANHFRVPDLRGEFIRGWDHGRGVDTDRVFGSNQDDDFRSHSHQAKGYNLLTGSSNAFWWGDDASGPVTKNTLPTGGSETRPRNVALLPCIKAFKTVTGTVQSLNFLEKPASASSGQVLTYNGSTSTWVASAAPAPATSSNAFAAKAWVNFSGTKDTSNTTSGNNTDRFINSSYNVTSVTRTGQGLYTINFATNTFTDTNYVYTFGYRSNERGIGLASIAQFDNKTTNYIQIVADDDNQQDNNDLPEICVVFYGIGGDISGQSLNFLEKPASASSGQVLTYNGSTSTWVASSLSAIGFTASLSSNGYTYLPNGIIMQWGRIFVSSLLEQAISIQYPISFPNSIYNLTPTLSTITTTSNGGNMSLYVKDMNLNGATIWADSDSPTFTNSYILWQAIGY